MSRRIAEQTAAAYLRFSSEMQDPRFLEDQLRRVRAWASANGLSVEDAHVYRDASISGATADREGLQAMLTRATARKRAPWSAVIVDDLSRLSRSMGDFWRIVDNLYWSWFHS